MNTTPMPAAAARRPFFDWPGWSHLPREARDTLFLLGVIGWTVMPHLWHLPLWCAGLTGLVLVWRAKLALAAAALPRRRVLLGMLVIAAGLTFFSYRSLLGKDPGVAMAVALMALKTLELRARRDAFVVFFLGFFLILTHFLFSQSVLVAAAMVVSIWGLLTALVLANMPAGAPSLRKAGGIAGKTALWGAPVMALLFVLFPRVGPLWNVPQDGLSSTGLSNIMSMGTVASLAQDNSVALRIRFEGTPPAPQDVYFRGPVLGHFDGRDWTPQKPSFPEAMTPRAELAVKGRPIPYEMTLEPLRMAVIPMLEASPVAPQIDGVQITQHDDLQWVPDRPLFERLRFNATAYPRFRHGPREPMVGLQDYLDLPAGFNPRTLAWAFDMRRQPAYAEADAATLARAVMSHISRGGYSYTLTPGTYGDEDRRSAIDEFWLDRKAGFCEHYAAAFVVVMRAFDVPARVVTGYQGLDTEPVDGYYIVRQSYAHAWAEYWQAGIGWVRADPTSSVAPDRVLRSRPLVSQPGLMAGALGNVNPQLWAVLRNGWEATNNRWNQWVLSYSRGAQFDLLKQLGFSAPGWEDLGLVLAGIVSAMSLIGLAWTWLERRHLNPWVRQMNQVRAALNDINLPAAEHDAPRALARRIREHLGPAGEPMAMLLEHIDAQRYGRHGAARPDHRLTRAFAAQAQHLKRHNVLATNNMASTATV
jgi:protein-glutamine gamma-glutamyltransferase